MDEKGKKIITFREKGIRKTQKEKKSELKSEQVGVRGGRENQERKKKKKQQHPQRKKPKEFGKRRK